MLNSATPNLNKDNGTPLAQTKMRAHSIHVSIPTSKSQIKNQPIPVYALEWSKKEEESKILPTDNAIAK